MKEIRFGPMEGSIAFQVHLTWRAIKKGLLADAKRSTERVTRGSYSIPILIGFNPGISPQELAAILYLDASKISVILRQLESAGHIERMASKEDGRRVELRLTETGKAYAQRASASSKQIEARWSDVLTPAEAAEFVRLLHKIRKRG